jgi:uncharacterized protein
MKKKLKTSNYNFIWKLNKKKDYLLYNSRTTALLLIPHKDLDSVESVLKNPLDTNTDLIKILKHGNFLISENINEIDLIRIDLFKGRFDKDQLNLVINPTFYCNFSCLYCFESPSSRSKSDLMKIDVQDAIITLLKGQVNTISTCNIRWFGGEPLIGLSVIKKLSPKLIEICNDNDIRYSAEITTNGFLLTKQAVDALVKYKVKSIQVTLDGTKKTHDKRRPLKHSLGSTYNKIMSNLEYAARCFEDILIRINIDRDNINEAEELLTALKGINTKSNIRIFPGRVVSKTDYNSSYNQKCLSCNEFSIFDKTFRKKMKKNGFYFKNYPKRIANVCSADKYNSFMIGPDGNIYKCFEELGEKSKIIGNILDFKNLDNHENFSLDINYMSFDPTVISKCKNCKVLPLCMGGCPKNRINKKKIECDTLKYNLKNIIISHALGNTAMEKNKSASITSKK